MQVIAHDAGLLHCAINAADDLQRQNKKVAGRGASARSEEGQGGGWKRIREEVQLQGRDMG